MKMFGGNGRRADDSGRGANSRRPGDTGRNNINNDNRGNNNTGSSRRDATPPPKKKKNGGKGVLIALVIIAIIVGGVFIYWKVTTAPPETANQTPADPEATVSITDTDTREVGRYYTVLLVGKDQIGCNTDTIMVVRYDAVDHKANMISIPRDTLVNIPESVKKINTIYYNDNGGIEALMNGVKDVLGFRPDSYVVVDTSAFEQVVDCLGGFYFDVPVDMNYEDPVQNLSIHIEKGYQWLNGENALKVYRFRATYGMGDIDRLEVQHNLIKEAASQMLKLSNITNLFEAAKIISDNSETNLTYGNMQWYAGEFLKMSIDDINIMTLPGNNSCSIRKGSYVSINVDDWLAMVNQYLNPLKQEITVEDCNILYQVAADSGYDPEAKNYAVTNGGEVAGGIDSFYHFG